LATELLKDYFRSNGNIIQRVGQAVECFFILCFYHQLLKKPANKLLIRIAFVAYTISVLIYYPAFEGSFNVDFHFDYILQSFLVCVLVCLFFFELLDYKGDLALAVYAAFWLNAVHLMFYGGNFFAMALFEKLDKASPLRSIPSYLNLFLYTSYLIIFLSVRKRVHHVE
jgi:hypothetical protein